MGSGNRCFGSLVNDGSNPLSALTVASLADIGYDVNGAAAEDFELPSRLELMMMGVGAEPAVQTCCTLGGANTVPPPRELPASALV